MIKLAVAAGQDWPSERKGKLDGLGEPPSSKVDGTSMSGLCEVLRRNKSANGILGIGGQMPYLQLDTPFSHTAEDKKKLAKRFGEIFADQMSADVNRVTVAVRELGDGNIWRCSEDEPRPAALLMCDIRKGRSSEQRAELARLLIKACKEILGLKDENLNVEFTQHDGDEMYHTLYGGLSKDWVPGEPDELSSRQT